MHARAVMGAAVLLLSLFACWRLYQGTSTVAAFEVLGMDVPQAALWAGGLFIALGALVFLFTFGLNTGLKGLDARTHRLIDLLIDTEAELAKVSWPSREELTASTTAVLVSIVVLGALLFCIDSMTAFVMGILKVLPK